MERAECRGAHEIRWHGRGGQGAVTSAKLLADASFRRGWTGITSAPTFGAERRGAPVTASTRLSCEPIRVFSQVVSPDIVIVLDESLVEVGGAAVGLADGGLVIVNTSRDAAELDLPSSARVFAADVTGAAQACGVLVGGTPIVSAAILGSVSKATGVVDMESIELAIGAAFPPAAADKNIEAARIAFACTTERTAP